MTHNEAVAHAKKINATVECVREKLGRNKRRVSYRVLRDGKIIAESPVGWKAAFLRTELHV